MHVHFQLVTRRQAVSGAKVHQLFQGLCRVSHISQVGETCKSNVLHLTFATTNVTSSCCGASRCHSFQFAIMVWVNSQAVNFRDSATMEISRSSPNSSPAGFNASVTPSV